MNKSSHLSRGLALRELLLVVALLTVAFGLMVSLARRVRSEAAHSLVQRELLELDDALKAYQAEFGRFPEVLALFPPAEAVESAGLEVILRERATAQNRAMVRALSIGARPEDAAGTSPLGGVSAMMFDGSLLLDPWGTPIAFLSRGRAEIGTASGDAPFFFSAGPDGRFLTREDNIYSYEVLERAFEEMAPPPAEPEEEAP